MNLLLSLLLLVAPAPVKTEHGRFNITKDGQNIGTDEFDVTSNFVKSARDVVHRALRQIIAWRLPYLSGLCTSDHEL